jgi:hypothetical protein
MARSYGSTENVFSPYISCPMAADNHLLQRAPERAYFGLLLSNTVNLELLTPGLAPP